MSVDKNTNNFITIEDNINNSLSDGNQKNALKFVSLLKANGMTADKTLFRTNSITYKDEDVCYLEVNAVTYRSCSWRIAINANYSDEQWDEPLEESMKEIVWAIVNFCYCCGGGCLPGCSRMILGKQFEYVCGTNDIKFKDPDAKALECAIKLVEMRKREIDGKGKS